MKSYLQPFDQTKQQEIETKRISSLYAISIYFFLRFWKEKFSEMKFDFDQNI
jgi:hypothetical protein